MRALRFLGLGRVRVWEVAGWAGFLAWPAHKPFFLFYYFQKTKEVLREREEKNTSHQKNVLQILVIKICEENRCTQMNELQCMMHDVARRKTNEQQTKLLGANPGALQPTPLTRDRALAVQPKQGEREESYYGSSRSMLIFSTPLKKGDWLRIAKVRSGDLKGNSAPTLSERSGGHTVIHQSIVQIE